MTLGRAAILTVAWASLTLGGVSLSHGADDPWTKSERWFAVLRDRPSQTRALHEIVAIFSAADRTDELIAHLREHAGESRDRAILLARAHERLGDAAAAAAVMDEFSASFGSDRAYAEAHAELLEISGRPADAARIWESLATSDAGGVLLRASDAWTAAGHSDEASAALARAVEADPEKPDLRERIATALTRRGAASEAIPHWQWLAERGRPATRVTALLEIARIHEASGKFSPADEALRDALQRLGPGHPLREEVEFRRVALAVRADTVDEFVAELTLQAQDEADATARQSLARALALLGRSGLAVDDEAPSPTPEAGVAESSGSSEPPADAAATEPSEIARLVSSGQIDEAIETTDALVTERPDEAERLDRALFEALAAADPGEADTPAALVAGLIRQTQPGQLSHPAILARERNLGVRFQEQPDEAAAIRLARWQGWRGDADGALATLRSAQERFPESIAVLDHLVGNAERAGRSEVALAAVDALQRLQPERHGELVRMRARILLDRESFSEAQQVLEDAVAADGPSPELLMALASARQRGGNYAHALDAWQQAYDLAGPAERGPMRAPILAVIDRLGIPARGVEFLVADAVGQPDPAMRAAGLKDAAEFAVSRGAADFLADQLRARQRESPQDPALRLALAELASLTGQPGVESALLWDALAAPGERSEVLRRMLETARLDGDWNRAVFAAAALARERDTPDAWLLLAEVQEQAGRNEDAMISWRQLRRRFGTQPEILTAAAEFFHRSGHDADSDEARLALAGLAGSSPKDVLAGARIALDTGDRDRALELLDQLLASTPEVDPSERLYPGAMILDSIATRRAFTLANRAVGGFTEPDVIAVLRAPEVDPRPDDTLRLDAIRLRSSLSAGGTEREAWDSWIETNPSEIEQMTALDALGDTAAALALLREAGQSGANPEAERAFASLALAHRDGVALREWIDADPTRMRRRMEFLLLALSLQLQHGEWDLSVVDEVFPADGGKAITRWQVAWLFSTYGRFQEAISLTENLAAYTPITQRAMTAQSLATWHLVQRDPVAAVQALDIPLVRSAATLDQPVFHAWRTRWLLESEHGRRTMKDDVAGTDDPLLALGIAGIDAALRDDGEGTQQYARELVSAWLERSGGDPATEPFLATVHSSVSAALQWRLPLLAYELVNAVLALDPALLAVSTDSGTSERMDLLPLRARIQLSVAPPWAISGILTSLPPSLRDPTNLLALSRALDALQASVAADFLRVEVLSIASPLDSVTLDELAETARRNQDPAGELAALRASPPGLQHFPTAARHAIRLSELILETGDAHAALAALDPVTQTAPYDPGILAAIEAAVWESGDSRAWVDFARTRANGNAAALPGLLRALAATGDTAGIPAVLDEAARAGITANPDWIRALVEVSLPENPEQAAAHAQRLAAGGHWDILADCAEWFRGTAHGPRIAALLLDGALRAPSDATRLACAEAFAGVRGGGITPEEMSKVFEELEAVAGRTPELGESVVRVGDHLLFLSPTAAADWIAQWQDVTNALSPQRAVWRIAAGTFLPVDAPAFAGVLAERGEFTASDWMRIGTAFSEAGFLTEAADAFLRAANAEPLNHERTFRAGMALWRAGQRHESRRLIEPFMKMRAIDPAISIWLARYYLDCGDPAMAAQLAAELVARDPAITLPGAWTLLAEVDVAVGHHEDAKILLHAAYQNPTLRDPLPLASWLIATSQIPAPDDPFWNGMPVPVRNQAIAQAVRDVGAGVQSASLQAWIHPDLLTSKDGRDLMDVFATIPALEPDLAEFWQKAVVEAPHARRVRDSAAQFWTISAGRADAAGDVKLARGRLRIAREAAPWNAPATIESIRMAPDTDVPEILAQFLASGADVSARLMVLREVRQRNGGEILPRSSRSE